MNNSLKCMQHHHELRLGLLRACNDTSASGAIAERLEDIQREAAEHEEFRRRVDKLQAERESAKRKTRPRINRKAVLHRADARLRKLRADASVLAAAVSIRPVKS
eukprot:jgi/Ulvmu1/1582/UM111_0010.1